MLEFSVHVPVFNRLIRGFIDAYYIFHTIIKKAII